MENRNFDIRANISNPIHLKKDKHKKKESEESKIPDGQLTINSSLNYIRFDEDNGGTCHPDDYEESDYEKKIRGVD